MYLLQISRRALSSCFSKGLNAWEEQQEIEKPQKSEEPRIA